MKLYDLKKSGIESLSPMSPEEYISTWKDIEHWYKLKPKTNYFMLLSWEAKYVTLLERAEATVFDSFVDNLQECINNIGLLKAVEEDEGGGLIFWINNEAYLLFPYDEGVALFS